MGFGEPDSGDERIRPRDLAAIPRTLGRNTAFDARTVLAARETPRTRLHESLGRVYVRGVTTGRRRLLLRSLELTVLFVLFPLALVPFGRLVGPYVLPLIVCLGFGASLALVWDNGFKERHLVALGGLRRALPGVLLRLTLGGALLAALVLLWRPTLFLSFAREHPLAFAGVLVVYPLLSAWPQEIVFRAFFFRRYGELLGTKAALIAASGLTFGIAHVFFGNWIAPTLSTAGGLLFAHTYARTKSLTAVALEHALWGNLIFTVGLGRFFFGGAIG